MDTLKQAISQYFTSKGFPSDGPNTIASVVVIDLQTQTVVQRITYRGTMANPQSLVDGQWEVTWAEGGAVRIVGSGVRQRCRWSQPRATWEEGTCPPDAILRAIFAAIG